MLSPPLFLTLACLLVLFSCQTPSIAPPSATHGPSRKAKNPNEVTVTSAESGIDLTSYLRRIPGLQVQGNGENASLRVRFNASFETENRPLIVLNGIPLGYNYSSLYTVIDPNDIDKVSVLKTPDETSRYGIQGSSGVVEVTTRKQ
ncbi:MAG: TonB-dependent receptor plug domain-containing protein [Lewinella sp.]|nr:TonB-dependent receptor plug domain-containing protein [Lewinella sp.]